MKLYLVNGSSIVSEPFEPEYLLQTFFSMNKIIEKEVNIFIDRRGNNNFILDSGAFSLFNGVKKLTYCELIKYCDRYCDYINKYNIENFLEMDIDAIVGYDVVKKINKYIESKVGRKPIYVFHHETRTKEDLLENIKSSDYIFWGGIAKGGIKSREFAQAFINEAYKYGTKVHMLGYTPLNLDEYKNLYSCDSSSWTMGGRNGMIYNFNNNKLSQQKLDDKRRITFYELNNHNMRSWIKYSQYLKNKGYITE